MKRIKLLSMLAFATFVAVSFNACKGDDGGDDNEGIYNSEEWTEIGDSVKYSVAFSNLDDDDNTLSFKQKYTFVKPIDASVEYSYTFKYEPNNAVVPDSTVNDSVVAPATDDSEAVDKSNYPIVEGRIEVKCSNSEVAEMFYETMREDTADYTVVLDGTTIKCEWKKSKLSEMTYASVVLYFETLKKGPKFDFNQGGNVPDTTQNQQPVVVDTKNSVVVGIGDGARVFKTNHAYYNLAAVEGGDSTLVTLWFANYDFNKKERKPNVLTLSFVVSGKIESLEALPADTIGNVAISFKGNKPSSLDFSGFGYILVGANSVEITDYVYNINTPVQPFSYTGTITKFDATNVEEEEEQDNPGHNGIEGNIQTVGNKVTLTLDAGGYTEVYEAEFVNDKCSNCTCVMEYSSEQYAKLVYETLKSEGGYTLNGKAIIADVTKDYKGLTKAEVETAFKALQDAYQSK